MKTTIIRCHCGQRILAKDVLQRNWYVRVYGPSFMYLKYRCSRCKRLGEKLIEQDKWDDTILRDIPSEMSIEEKRRFDRMGKISVDEAIDFHFCLDDPDTLGTLRREWEQEAETRGEGPLGEKPRGEKTRGQKARGEKTRDEQV